MSTATFAYIWRFTINPQRRAEFLEAYLPKGEWAQLFANDTNYIRTELLHDVKNPNQYVTVDYWASSAARDAFRTQYASAYAALDQKCEAYTDHEELIGDFEVAANQRGHKSKGSE